MWKYKSEFEITKIRKRKKKAYKEIRSPIFRAIFLFFFVAIMIKTGLPTVFTPQFHPMSWRTFLEKGIWKAFIFGLLIFFLNYIVQIVTKKPFPVKTEAMICLKCEKIKIDNKKYQCDCGGEFVPLDELEWVDDRINDSKNVTE